MKQNSFSKSLSSVFVISFCLLTLSFYSGCSEDENNPVSPTTQTAYISVIHSSPNAPNVDILFGSTVIASNVPFLGSFPYKGVAGNSVTRIRINVTGTSTTVIDTSIYCQDGKSYSVIAFDSVSKIKPLVISDDLVSPGSINSSIRFIHLSPNGPVVSVGVTGKPTWFPFYAFKDYEDFRAVTGATYPNLNVYEAGTTNVIYTLPNVNFAAGKIYTIIAGGFVGGSGSQAFNLTIYPNN